MSGDCRKSPIGRKSGSVNVFPPNPSQLELTTLVVNGSQDQSWNGTLIRAQITCPGLRLNYDVTFANGTAKILKNTAGAVVGAYQGTCRLSWPNGQRLVVQFNYRVTR
jgi:hypothetical protein